MSDLDPIQHCQLDDTTFVDSRVFLEVLHR